MKIKTIFSTLCLYCSVGIVATANAAIVSSTGTVEIITSPTSLERHVLESDTLIRAFDELSDVTLTGNLQTNGGPNGQFTLHNLESGLTVSSHLIHVDPAQAEYLNEITNASITFDQAIIGLIWVSEDLDTTDVLFGLPGTTYPVCPPPGDGPAGFCGRGAGTNIPGSDIFYVDPGDSHTLNINIIMTGLGFDDTGSMDQIRVLTAVPVPPAILLLGSGLLGLVSVSFRKHSKRA